jgi:hypothetical protein
MLFKFKDIANLLSAAPGAAFNKTNPNPDNAAASARKSKQMSAKGDLRWQKAA